MTLAGGDYSWRPILDGLIRVAAGDTAGARTMLCELARTPGRPSWRWCFSLWGQKDSAHILLERALATRDVDAMVVDPAIPELYPLHGEPRYQQLRERMG